MRTNELSLANVGRALLNSSRRRFPFDLVHTDPLPGPVGALITQFRELSMNPPGPWGQWWYGHLLAGLHDVSGDVAELGVARGGMSLTLASIAAQHGRGLVACDTFAGLPAPPVEHDNAYFRPGDFRGADGEDLAAAFAGQVAAAGLGGTVELAVGPFSETLPAAVDRDLAFVHIDCDLYDSAIQALEACWDRVSGGGLVAIDDFFHPSQGPARAAATFFNTRGIRPLLHVVFPYSVVLRKGETVDRWENLRAHDGNVYLLDLMRDDPVFVERARKSLEAASTDGGRPHHNAGRFVDLLTDPPLGTGDIYAYWSAMEDFWTYCSGRGLDGVDIEI